MHNRGSAGVVPASRYRRVATGTTILPGQLSAAAIILSRLVVMPGTLVATPDPLRPHLFTPSTTFPGTMCVCGLHRHHFAHRGYPEHK